ncbi:PH domain-containing protein [Aliiglaciecola litoralis]|uniref:PH domain-containing protein n=1 Tax=Aliiglaciecola litoralis TaxID=582857 RepID=UPI0031DEEFAA
MEFENNVLVSDQLPDPSIINFESLPPRYRTSVILSTVASFLMFTVVMSVYRLQPFFPVPPLLEEFYLAILLILFGLTCLVCCVQFITLPYKRYCLREHDLHFASGLVFRKIVSQPILRIQHVELKRGPIERLFNLATLQVFSAGGASHTFEIPGLNKETADRIRYFLLTHKDTLQNG